MATLHDLAGRTGFELPKVNAPGGAYASTVLAGGQLWVAGQLPRTGDDVRYAGIVGADLTVEDGRAAAELCALNTLAAVAGVVDDAEGLRLLHLSGFVRCGPDFGQHAAVIDGASDVFVRVLGEAGRHARTAVGAVSLPRGSAVEVATVWTVPQ